MHYLLLDVLNILHGAPRYRNLLASNLFASMEWLLNDVDILLASEDRQVIAVIDGGALGPLPEVFSRHPKLLVVQTTSGSAADTAILKILQRLRQSRPSCVCAVVSDDMGLRAGSVGLGAEVITVGAFVKQLTCRQQVQAEALKRQGSQVNLLWNNSLGNFLQQF